VVKLVVVSRGMQQYIEKSLLVGVVAIGLICTVGPCLTVLSSKLCANEVEGSSSDHHQQPENKRVDNAMEETYQELESYIIEKIRSMEQSQGPLWIGIAGPPASGKTTLATQVAKRVNKTFPTVVIPMDGYHYYRAQLDRMPDPAEAHRRRGAPFTFDAARFKAELAEARENGKGTFPTFDHAEGDPVEGGIAFDSTKHRVVIVEGNYLLLSGDPAWEGTARLFDETMFVECAPEVIRERIILRHMGTGLTRQAATVRADSNDVPNAQQVLDCRQPADRTIRSK